MGKEDLKVTTFSYFVTEVQVEVAERLSPESISIVSIEVYPRGSATSVMQRVKGTNKQASVGRLCMRPWPDRDDARGAPTAALFDIILLQLV